MRLGITVPFRPDLVVDAARRIDAAGFDSVWLPDAHNRGFLLPDVGSSTYLGSYVKVPYYISISPSRDLTIDPIITTRAGAVLQTEYRQRWNDSGLWLGCSL